MEEVRKRGRWASESGVRRYEKEGKTMSLVQGFGLNLREHVGRCQKESAAVMRGDQVSFRYHGE